ncbi:MAG: DUF4190 domain-containing protein [Clostridiales bacterium]|jgi:hypothetical protein|nr:DUF4190 domain-containing protein [Clostridiales bacterium]
MICIHCKSEDQIGAFCSTCGIALLAECRQCKSENQKGTFCSVCGAILAVQNGSDRQIASTSYNNRNSVFDNAVSSNQAFIDRGEGFAKAGFILGIVSFVPFATFLVSVLAIIFSSIALYQLPKNNQMRRKAIAGLICGIISIFVMILLFIYYMIIIAVFFNISSSY